MQFSFTTVKFTHQLHPQLCKINRSNIQRIKNQMRTVKITRQNHHRMMKNNLHVQHATNLSNSNQHSCNTNEFTWTRDLSSAITTIPVTRVFAKNHISFNTREFTLTPNRSHVDSTVVENLFDKKRSCPNTKGFIVILHRSCCTKMLAIMRPFGHSTFHIQSNWRTRPKMSAKNTLTFLQSLTPSSAISVVMISISRKM